MLTLEALRFSRPGFSLAADLSVEAGARVAIIGPSGGGKSTLLALIAGFESPQTGDVCWEHQSMLSMAPGSRPLSMIFQDANLFPHLSVSKNVGLGLRPNLHLTHGEKSRVVEVLAQVGLGDLAERKPGELSGGQRARVALARALLRKRPLLLLDEAFSALGPALKAEMFDLVEATMGDGSTSVLMVTHDPEEARRMDQIIVVDDGVAEPPSDAAALLREPTPALRAYLGNG